MDLDKLHGAMIGAARKRASASDVPPFFAKRVAAVVAGLPRPALSHWSSELWRAAIPCSAVALAVAGWALWRGAIQDTDWSREFEHAVVVAAVEQESQQAW